MKSLGTGCGPSCLVCFSVSSSGDSRVWFKFVSRLLVRERAEGSSNNNGLIWLLLGAKEIWSYSLVLNQKVYWIERMGKKRYTLVVARETWIVLILDVLFSLVLVNCIKWPYNGSVLSRLLFVEFGTGKYTNIISYAIMGMIGDCCGCCLQHYFNLQQ